MTKAQKIVHVVCIALIVVGLFGILGTAGRADTTDATIASLMVQLAVSCGVVLAGIVGEAVLAKK